MTSKITVGNVYAIPLPNGKYGFGKKFRDPSIGIYKHTGTSAEDLPHKEDFQFIVGVYDRAIKSEGWKVVDYRPFKTVEDEWPPPMCVIDKISVKYSIYHKGEIKKANKEDCVGLEVASVWDANHIIDRIMGTNKWHKG